LLSITGGRFKGLPLRTPTGRGVTRPTSGKTRQALFNILAGKAEGSDFLDLYAGSGAVGLEALSRGYRTTTLVEHHPAAWKCLTENCGLLAAKGADPLSMVRVREKAREFCNAAAREGRRFGVVFADPPFAVDFSGIWDWLQPLVAEGGAGVLQFPTRKPPDFGPWGPRVYAYGESSLAVFSAVA
jgi:16S rRNA (guanine(966)-N(2))-methyltransferase RsmD